jgi:hypothetical protein
VGRPVMCKTCDILMDDYKCQVGLFKSAVRRFTEAIGDDSTRRAAESGAVEAGVS